MSETLEILEIEKDIACIRDINNELNEIAKKHNIKLDLLENNIMNITQTVKEAEDDIGDSDKYKKTNIKRTIYTGIATGSVLTYLMFGSITVVPIGVFAIGSYIALNKLSKD
jgi:hypothetical protein